MTRHMLSAKNTAVARLNMTTKIKKKHDEIKANVIYEYLVMILEVMIVPFWILTN